MPVNILSIFMTFFLLVGSVAYCNVLLASANDFTIEEIRQTTNSIEGVDISAGEVSWSEIIGSPTNGFEAFHYDGVSASQLTNDNYSDLPPVISEGVLYWRKAINNGYDIYRNDGQTTSLIASYPGKTVWSLETHDGQAVWSVSDGNDDEIYLYDGSSIIQLTNNQVNDTSPSIHNGQVAWRQGSGVNYVMLFNGSSTIQLSSNLTLNGPPRVYDGQVVWTDDPSGQFNDDVYLYNGSTVEQITNTPQREMLPNIGSDTIAWLVQTGIASGELYVHQDGATSLVSEKYETLNTPSVSGRMVAWYESTTGGDFDIFAFRDGQVIQITQDAGVNHSPEADGDQIAWQRVNPPFPTEQQIKSVFVANFADSLPIGLQIEYRNGNGYVTNTPWIQPHLRIVNNGIDDVPLNDLSIRYWYSNETDPASQIFTVNSFYDQSTWQPIGSWPYPDVSAGFSAVSSIHADTVCEVSFSTNAGAVTAGSAIVLEFGFHAADWSNYNQSNDYSGIMQTSNFAVTNMIGLYYKNQLIWGVEP